LEKKFKKTTIYMKANNIFNTKMVEFIKLGDAINAGYPLQKPNSGETIISQEYYGQTYLAGIRFKL
jgi:hypothetical protein